MPEAKPLLLGVLGAIALGILAAVAPAWSQANNEACKPEAIFAVIDATGARLRDLNNEAQPRIRAKLKELARVKGWSDAELETKGRQAIDDASLRAFDQVAAKLLAEISQLAEDLPADPAAVCQRLDQARAKSGELVGVTAARTEHALAQIDVAMRSSGGGGGQATTPSASQETTAAAAPSAAQPPVTKGPTATPPAPPRDVPAKQAAAAPKAKAPVNPPAPSWEAQRVKEGEPTAAVQPAPPPEVLPPPPDPGSLGFTPEDIRAAGRGLFGSLSAGLASVIDYAFQNYGKPTGYVLGNEGGAAFFAGLRYGEGRLVTKQRGERRVFWQGPSAGFDWGVTGSRVMFLVYSIEEHEQLFQRFTGVEGSAYFVGGVGITFLKRGKLILAPIRTGIGLRVGANIGYLKFTPNLSLNPF